MAQIGTLTAVINSPEIKTWTWVVASEAAAGASSPVLDLRGMDMVEWFVSSVTGLSSGTFETSLAFEQAGNGILPDDARQVRMASTATVNASGSCAAPPPNAFLYVTGLGTTPSAWTIKIVAWKISGKP